MCTPAKGATAQPHASAIDQGERSLLGVLLCQHHVRDVINSPAQGDAERGAQFGLEGQELTSAWSTFRMQLTSRPTGEAFKQLTPVSIWAEPANLMQSFPLHLQISSLPALPLCARAARQQSMPLMRHLFGCQLVSWEYAASTQFAG